MNLYALTLAVIVLTLLTVSLTRLGKVHTRADYLVTGRSLPAFVLVFTLLSSWIGSGSLLGGAELAYRHGFVALWVAGGGWAGLALIYFIAPRARRFAQYTIPDLLEARYNQTTRVLGVIAVLFTYTAITSYQFIGGGDILHLIFPSVTAIHGRYLIAAFVIVFTAIAGMSSVAYMDVAIGLLATFTLCTALPVLVHSFAFANLTGWSAVHAALPATHFQALRRPHSHPGDGTLSSHLPADARQPVHVPEVFLRPLRKGRHPRRHRLDRRHRHPRNRHRRPRRHRFRGLPHRRGPRPSPRNPCLRRPPRLLSRAVRHDPPQRHWPSHRHYHQRGRTLHRSPRLLGALLVGAIFAKIVSTANNYLFSPATNLVNDLFVRYLRPNAGNKQTLLVSRAMVVLLGLWALYQGLHTESVLKKALYAYTIYSAALTPVILAAFYWRRATASAAVASIFTGTFVTVFWDTAFIHTHLPAILAERDAIFPALIASLLCLIVVSLFTPPPTESHLRAFADNAHTS